MMEQQIQWEGADRFSALIMDPVPGSNIGFPIPPEGYLPAVRALCDRYGMLLIFDEIQTGFGKTGKMFACEHWNVVPDIMAIGKGFTGGYVPLGATVTTPDIYKVFQKSGHELRSGSTYGGHTLACAATLANIRVIEEQGLVEQARKRGSYLREKLAQLSRHRIVGGVSGIGLLQALFLYADNEKKTPLDPGLKVGNFIRDHCYANGMIMRNNGDILVMAPALIITEQQIDAAIDILEQALVAAMKRYEL
jgi:putrescine aminotransferase